MIANEIRVSDAPYGRIRAFELEAEVAGGWKPVATGTNIGARLRIAFAPTRARRLRLLIHDATDTPTLAEFQIFGP